MGWPNNQAGCAKFWKLINGQGSIRAGRVSNFSEINKRACPFIRQVWVLTNLTYLVKDLKKIQVLSDFYFNLILFFRLGIDWTNIGRIRSENEGSWNRVTRRKKKSGVIMADFQNSPSAIPLYLWFILQKKSY